MKPMRKRQSPQQMAEMYIKMMSDPPGFEIFETIKKGRGVRTTKNLIKGDFILQYKGELVEEEPSEMEFVFEFKYRDKIHWLDATEDGPSLARLINDDHIDPNCKPKMLEVDGVPRIVFYALCNINTGEELTYDYGAADYPWRQCPLNIHLKFYMYIRDGSTIYLHRGRTGVHGRKTSICTNVVKRRQFSDVIIIQPINSKCDCRKSSKNISHANIKATGSMSGSALLETRTALAEEPELGEKICSVQQEDYEKSNRSSHANIKATGSTSALLETTALAEESEFGEEIGFVQQEALVVISEKGADIGVYPIRTHKIFIGSGKFCDIIIKQAAVASLHARLIKIGNQIRLTNLCRKLPVQVNNKTIFNSCLLKHEDTITIGTRMIRYDKCTQGQPMFLQEPEDHAVRNCQPVLQEESEESDLEDEYDLNDSDKDADYEMSEDEELSDEVDENISDVEEDEKIRDEEETEPVHAVETSSQCSEVLSATACGVSMQDPNNKKLHFCLFCEQPLQKMARHLETVHPEEPDVARILNLQKKSKERKKAWNILLNKGNFKHNFAVLERKEGLLVPKYRKKSASSTTDRLLIPCEFCLGFYSKVDLWEHQRRCPCKRKESNDNKPGAKGRGIRNGRLLLPVQTSRKDLYENCLVNMHDDDIKPLIEQDPLIIQFGNRLFDKHGHDSHSHQYISQKLRELGRLLKATKNLEENRLASIDECLNPMHWESLLKGVKCAAGYDAEKNSYKTPSLALKLGHSLMKCAKLVKTASVVAGDNAKKQSVLDFMTLYQDDWEDRVSNVALRTVDKNNYNKPKMLPIASDVIKLQQYLRNEGHTARAEIEKGETAAYSRLAKVCLTEIILFNRKRCGDVERIELEELEKGLKSDYELDESDMTKSLSKFEMHLVHQHKRIETRGKKGRKVPVLLPKHIVENLSFLIKQRKAAGVRSKLLFGKPGAAKFPYRGVDTLRLHATQCGAAHPERLRSTKLRQQLATMSQALNLSESDQDQLATFLGHDLVVHRKFYRLTEDVFQAAKVSKLLHLINNGKLLQHHGQNYDDITFDAEETIEDEPASEEEKDTEDEPFEESFVQGQFKESSDEEVEPSQAKKRKVHRWTEDEKGAIRRQLDNNLRTLKAPSRNQCDFAIRHEPALRSRTWLDVKNCVHNMNQTMKRRIHNGKM